MNYIGFFLHSITRDLNIRLDIDLSFSFCELSLRGTWTVRTAYTSPCHSCVNVWIVQFVLQSSSHSYTISTSRKIARMQNRCTCGLGVVPQSQQTNGKASTTPSCIHISEKIHSPLSRNTMGRWIRMHFKSRETWVYSLPLS